MSLRRYERTRALVDGDPSLAREIVREAVSYTHLDVYKRQLEAGMLARIPLAGHLIEHDFTFIRPKGSVFGAEYARLFDDLRSV